MSAKERLLDEEAFSVRPEAVELGRCKGCGWEGPAYLEHCRRCPAILGEPHRREIALIVPDVPRGGLPAGFLAAAAFALELSGSPYHVEALCAEARAVVGALLAALPSSAAVLTLPSGVLVAVVAAESLAGSVAGVARAAATLEGNGSLECRAGIAVGLVDGAQPERAAVVEHAARLARAAQPNQTLTGYGAAWLLDREWQFYAAGVLARREEDFLEAATALRGRKQPAPTPSALVFEQGPCLVGRVRELAALEDELARAREGGGGWCGLVAPAGGGKSKLLRSWLRRVDGTGVRVVGVAASPFGQAPRALVDQLFDALGAPVSADARADEVVAVLVDALARGAAGRPLLVVIR